MSVLAALVLGITLGAPCAMLAAAIAYHGRLSIRMPAADEGWDPGETGEVSSPFAFPTPPEDDVAPELLQELQDTIVDLQQQLTAQRVALAELLSPRADEPQEARRAEAASPATQVDLPGAVRQFRAEGMSERAIARRLGIALEEVRLVAQRVQAS